MSYHMRGFHFKFVVCRNICKCYCGGNLIKRKWLYSNLAKLCAYSKCLTATHSKFEIREKSSNTLVKLVFY